MASFSRNSLNSNNLNVPHKDIGIESKTYDSAKINNYSKLNNSEVPSEIDVGFNDCYVAGRFLHRGIPGGIL